MEVTTNTYFSLVFGSFFGSGFVQPIITGVTLLMAIKLLWFS
jgi:hypothetical protein